MGRRLGLQFDDARVEQLASAARERAEALGVGLDEWLSRVDAGDAAEVRALAERLTVGETYFFRNTNDLRAFVGAVLPERMRGAPGRAAPAAPVRGLLERGGAVHARDAGPRRCRSSRPGTSRSAAST